MKIWSAPQLCPWIRAIAFPWNLFKNISVNDFSHYRVLSIVTPTWALFQFCSFFENRTDSRVFRICAILRVHLHSSWWCCSSILILFTTFFTQEGVIFVWNFISGSVCNWFIDTLQFNSVSDVWAGLILKCWRGVTANMRTVKPEISTNFATLQICTCSTVPTLKDCPFSWTVSAMILVPG